MSRYILYCSVTITYTHLLSSSASVAVLSSSQVNSILKISGGAWSNTIVNFSMSINPSHTHLLHLHTGSMC